MNRLEEIPISAAKEVAEKYGYDQVVILARRCHDTPDPHGSWATTYGKNVDHSRSAARWGQAFRDLENDNSKIVPIPKTIEEEIYTTFSIHVDDGPTISWNTLQSDKQVLWREIGILMTDRYHHSFDRVDCAKLIYNWLYHTYDVYTLMEQDGNIIEKWLKVGQVAKTFLQKESRHV